MAPTDDTDASTASGASMMPGLPEPWEGLVREALNWAREDGMDSMEPCDPGANHAAFESERALRLALLDLLHGGA